MLPSELFRRQMWATFQDDEVGVRLAEDYAPDSFCWASDYPHSDGVWPDSQYCIRETMQKISKEARKKLTHDNVVRMFNLEWLQ